MSAQPGAPCPRQGKHGGERPHREAASAPDMALLEQAACAARPRGAAEWGDAQGAVAAAAGAPAAAAAPPSAPPASDRDPQRPAGPHAWPALRLLRLAEAEARGRAAEAAAERGARYRGAQEERRAAKVATRRALRAAEGRDEEALWGAGLLEGMLYSSGLGLLDIHAMGMPVEALLRCKLRETGQEPLSALPAVEREMRLALEQSARAGQADAVWRCIDAVPAALRRGALAGLRPRELLERMFEVEREARMKLERVLLKGGAHACLPAWLLGVEILEGLGRRVLLAAELVELLLRLPSGEGAAAAVGRALCAMQPAYGELLSGVGAAEAALRAELLPRLRLEEEAAREPLERLALQGAARRGWAAVVGRGLVSAPLAAAHAAAALAPGVLLGGLEAAEEAARAEKQRQLERKERVAQEPLQRQALVLAQRSALAVALAATLAGAPGACAAAERAAAAIGISRGELLLCLPAAEAAARAELCAAWGGLHSAEQLAREAYSEIPAVQKDERRERELLAAAERQTRELHCAALLAAADASLPVKAQRGATRGAGLGAAAPAEAPALARLAVAETEAQRDAALAELREALAAAPVASLRRGFAAAAAAELPCCRGAEPGSPTSPLAGTRAAQERARAAAEAEGFAARQQQGAVEGVAAVAAEPDAVRHRREQLRPAFSEQVAEQWRARKAPEGRPLGEAACDYVAALRRLTQCIDCGVPREAGCRAVDFILDLPERLHAAAPSTKDWFTAEHVSTTTVWQSKGVRVPHRRGTWLRRDTGLLGMLRDVLERVTEQVQWVDGHGLWDSRARIPELVAAAKAGDGLSGQQLQLLSEDAERSAQSLTALLQWETATALEMTVAGFLYCANLSPLRFGTGVFDAKGNPVKGYAGTLKKNCSCQLYFVWNKALREHTDPEWPLPRSDEERASNQRIVDLFAPMSYLLTELIRSSAAVGAAPVVSRGISVRISEKYITGTAVPQAQFTSTSTNDGASLKFAGAAGTWMKMQVINAASVAWCSPYPSERELLLPPGTMTEVGFKFGGTLLMLLESRRDLVFLCEWSEEARGLEETVEQRCRTLKDTAMLFEDFCTRFVEPRCNVYEGDEEEAKQKGRALFKVFSDFLASAEVHLVVLVGGGGIGKSSSLVALMREASDAADWVPFFDGLHQIDGLLDRPDAPAESGCYLGHLKRRALQCSDPDAALRLFLQRRVFHALDSLDETAGTLPAGAPLLQSMGLEAGPRSKVGISTRPEHLREQSILMRHLHGGKVWRLELLGFGAAEAAAFAEQSAKQWAGSEEGRRLEPAGSGAQPAVERARGAVAALRKADPTLARTPFVVKMAVELAIAGQQEVAAGAELKWHLVSDWVQLQVQRGAARFPQLAEGADTARVCAQAARVAMGLAVLLLFTGEWQGVLARFAAVLRRPALLTLPPQDEAQGRAGRRASDAVVGRDRLPFSPPLGAAARSELAAHLDALLAGVPPQRVRELLGALPLRCEHLDSDSGLFSFRHKIVAEWVVVLWVMVQCAAPPGAASFCSAALRRFASPLCWDSQQLLVAQLGADGGLLRVVVQLCGGRRQSLLSEGEMPQRLRRMAAVKHYSDPLPLLPARDWVRDEFAPKVTALYGAGRGALSRRQLGTVWSVGILGEADRALSDAEWAEERRVEQPPPRSRMLGHICHPGEPPSVLQAVRMSGGATAAAVQELTAEQVGQWLWALIDWLGGPTTRVLGDEMGQYGASPSLRLSPVGRDGQPKIWLGPRLGQGLLRLWEAADGAGRPWTLARVMWQLLPALMRRAVERRQPAAKICGVARFAAARLVALCPGSASEGLPPDGAPPLQLLVGAVTAPCQGGLPLRRAAAAEGAPAFRAAAAACWAGEWGDEATQDRLLSECWPARDGSDWAAVARLLSCPAELLRAGRVAALCAALEGGAAALCLGGRRRGTGGKVLDGLCPSAAQLRQLAAAARSGRALRRVSADGCARLAGAAEAEALLSLVTECEAVCELSVSGSPLPPDAPQRLAAALSQRGGDGLKGSVLDAEELLADLCQRCRRSQHIGARSEHLQASGAHLSTLCAALREGTCSYVSLSGCQTVADAEWEPLARLVRDCPWVDKVRIAHRALPRRVSDEICRILNRRRFGHFCDSWGLQESQVNLRDAQLREYGEISRA